MTALGGVLAAEMPALEVQGGCVCRWMADLACTLLHSPLPCSAPPRPDRYCRRRQKR